MYLMKGMAVLAMGLVAASCNKLDFDQDAYQRAKEQESKESFMNNVMGGQEIDPNQTWSTVENSTVNVSVNLNYGEDYTVYLFADNPTFNKNAKYLGVATVKSGESSNITLAKPADVNVLFAACMNKKGNYFVQRFEIEGTKASVSIGNAANNAPAFRRAATTINGVSVDPSTYIVTDNTYWKNDLLNYNNYEGYYDLTQVDAQHYDKLCYGINNEMNNGNQPLYGDGKHFIVPANTTVTGAAFNWNDGGGEDHVIVVKGTLKITGSMKLDCGKSIYVEQGGKLEFSGAKLEIANTSRLVNYGTMEFTNTYVDYANGPTYSGSSSGSTAMYRKVFYNGGIIKESNSTSKSSFNFAGGYNTDGQLTYYNSGSINLHAFQFNADATLVNVGHIKADTGKDGATQLTDLSASAQNGTVVNLCDMSIKMYGVNKYIGCNGSLMYCEDGLMTNYSGQITLGSQAMIEVGNWYDNGCTVRASDNADDYAVFKWNGTITEVNSGIFGAYGYVYFDGELIDDRPNNSYANDQERALAALAGYEYTHHYQSVVQPMQHFMNEETAPVEFTIAAESDGCNYIGYNEGEGGGDFTPNYVYYAFEDLGAIGDFDFNDVVIRVSVPNADGYSVVTLMCAGGTLPVQVIYGTGDNVMNLGSEVHSVFEVDVKTMVNTGIGQGVDFKSLGTVPVADGVNLDELPFGIAVTGNDGSTIKVTNNIDRKGTAPLMIVVNGYPSGTNAGKWFWPKERVNIATAYTDFGAWGANIESNTDWYQNFVNGSVWTY